MMIPLLSLTLLQFLIVVSGQNLNLTVQDSAVCGQNVTLRCTFTGTFSSLSARNWKKNGAVISLKGTISNPSKYEEHINNVASNYFELIIKSYTAADDDDTYTCDYSVDSVSASITCSEPAPPEPTPPVCIVEIRCRTLVIICGIFAGITAVMWVICCLLEYKKKECCQKWCCIRLIVLGFFAVTAWIFWGISYWQCVIRCQGSQKAVFIGPIVIGFCAGVAGIIWGIFCCLQHTGIIHCIPPKEEVGNSDDAASAELKERNQEAYTVTSEPRH